MRASVYAVDDMLNRATSDTQSASSGARALPPHILRLQQLAAASATPAPTALPLPALDHDASSPQLARAQQPAPSIGARALPPLMVRCQDVAQPSSSASGWSNQPARVLVQPPRLAPPTSELMRVPRHVSVRPAQRVDPATASDSDDDPTQVGDGDISSPDLNLDSDTLDTSDLIGIPRETVRPPHVSPAAHRAAQAAHGSHARAILLKDNKAASNAIAWLETSHPAWLQKKQNDSRIADPTLLSDELLVSMSRFGHRLIDQARCGVIAYDKFSAKHKNSFVGGTAYPPSSMLLTLFIRLALEQSQDKKMQKFIQRDSIDTTSREPKPVRAFKGTMGNARFKELAAAHEIFGAPFPKVLLDETVIQLAKLKPQGLPNLLEDKAAWPCSFQIKLETMAASSILSPQTLGFVRCLAIAGISGLRTIELLVSRFENLIEFSDKTIDQSTSRVALLYCEGAKPHQAADRKPFQALVRGAGFLGPWGWFSQFVEDLTPYPFVIRDFFRPILFKGGRGGTMDATKWRDLRCAPPDLVTRAFVDVAEAQPNPARESARVAAHLTPYGSRHVLPSVGRAAAGTDLAIPLELMNELGNWDPVAIQGIVEATAGGKRKRPKAAAASMPLRYAPNLINQLVARDRVVSIVANFIVRNGVGAVPIQMGETPTFDFLFQ